MGCPKCIDCARPGNETYCGFVSILLGIFLFPCICFCPVDQRTKGTGDKLETSQKYEY